MTEFIVTNGRQVWPTVQDRLARTEERIKQIERVVDRASVPAPSDRGSTNDIKEQVLTMTQDLQAALAISPQAGKQVLCRHIRKITLTPDAGGRRVFHVAIEFNLIARGSTRVVLPETVEGSIQQHDGFRALTVGGFELEIRRKGKVREPSSSATSVMKG